MLSRELDISLFQFLNSSVFQSLTLDTVIIFNAVFLGGYLILGIIIFLFQERVEWRLFRLRKPSRTHVYELTFILLVAFIAWVAALVVKLYALSPRPEFVLEGVNTLFGAGELDSFPSGHATFFFALAAGLFFYHRKLAIWYFFGALTVGVSRVIAGVHWPLDIVGGFAFGSMIAISVYYFYRLFWDKKARVKK